MTALSEEHESHIGRVQVSFVLSATDLDPDEVTEMTGLTPDESAKRGDERRNYKGQLITPHKEGFWIISSQGKVESKDINDHFDFLLDILLPHRKTFLQIIDELNGETYFDVLWTSSYLYAGTGPLISRQALRGISELGASMGFDIYQDEVIEKNGASLA